MDILDLVLNAAGLLLWLNWRMAGFRATALIGQRALPGALMRVSPSRASRWPYLVGLVVLLFARSAFYRQVGAALVWVPSIHLGSLTLPFRSDSSARMALFSWLSFGWFLAGFYVCLLLFSIANPRMPSTDRWQVTVCQHLGWIERVPRLVRPWLPPILAMILWAGLARYLSWLDLLPRPASTGMLLRQGFFLGLSRYLVWKPLLIGLFGVHIIQTYVYLGDAAILRFAEMTARNILAPLRRLPLRIGPVDLAPWLGIGLVLLAAHYAGPTRRLVTGESP